MIEKIVSIKNVGKFKNFIAHGNIAFDKLNLIFAENGQGKTTLAAIFRSLLTGESSYVEERATLGVANTPYIDIRCEGFNAKFREGSWDNTQPILEIFDSTFIDQNVYSGSSISYEHKKNLLCWVIGEEGVKLANRVSEINDEMRHLDTVIGKKSSKITQSMVTTVDVDEFVNLQPIDNIEREIKDTRRELKTLEEKNKLLSKDGLSKLNFPVLPEIGKLLSKGLTEISAEAERMVAAHIAENLDEEGESWINQGITYLKKKNQNCPFCGKDVSGVKLIAAYRKYFSKAYADFKKEIQEGLETIKRTLPEGKASSLMVAVLSNNAHSEFWAEHIEVNLPELPTDNLESVWIKTRNLFLDYLKRKAGSPLESIEMSKEILEIISSYSDIKHKIEDYNLSIETINQRIAAKKDEVKGGNILEVKEKLDRLQNVEKRFSEDTNKICFEYIDLKVRKTNLGTQKDQTKDLLNEHSARLLSEYQEKINSYLSKFGVGFQIVKTKGGYEGRKPNLTYMISINEVAVDLESSKQPQCFKNTLSSGDKSALAFAFFLSRLDLDSELQNKVIVLDDPIASLDAHRRTCTQQEISRIARYSRQLIVLSHDPHFLNQILNKTKGIGIKELCIKETTQGNVVSEWNVSEATMSQYSKDYSLLSNYLKKPEDEKNNPNLVVTRIRPLLEGYLRMRFHDKFDYRNYGLGSMIEKIRNADDADPLSSQKPYLHELSSLNGYSKDRHHFRTEGSDNERELKSYVERTLALIHGLSEPEDT